MAAKMRKKREKGKGLDLKPQRAQMDTDARHEPSRMVSEFCIALSACNLKLRLLCDMRSAVEKIAAAWCIVVNALRIASAFSLAGSLKPPARS